MTPKFSLVFYVPPSAAETCKKAIFKAGAGRYPGPGNYTECCWTVEGTGSFRAGSTAHPHTGKAGGEVEKVPEVRIETLVTGAGTVRNVVKALKEAHPYEEPAYHVYRLEDF